MEASHSCTSATRTACPLKAHLEAVLRDRTPDMLLASRTYPNWLQGLSVLLLAISRLLKDSNIARLNANPHLVQVNEWVLYEVIGGLLHE